MLRTTKNLDKYLQQKYNANNLQSFKTTTAAPRKQAKENDNNRSFEHMLSSFYKKSPSGAYFGCGDTSMASEQEGC